MGVKQPRAARGTPAPSPGGDAGIAGTTGRPDTPPATPGNLCGDSADAGGAVKHGARHRSRAVASAPLWGGLAEGDLVVVDTAPLIYVLEDHPQFCAQFAPLFAAHDEGRLRIAVSTITLAEVLAGPYRHGLEALARRYEKALHAFELTPVTAEIAALAARLRATTKLKLPDAMQAATALSLGAVALVTHDRDFSSLPGLPVLG